MGKLLPVTLQFVALGPVDDDGQQERLAVERGIVGGDFRRELGAVLASRELVTRAANTVVRALIEASLLVVVTLYLFLGGLRAALVVAATLPMFNLPEAGLLLILGIDRFMSECRALTNIIGNGVATVVMSAWEHELDRAQLDRALRRGGDETAELAEAGPGVR